MDLPSIEVLEDVLKLRDRAAAAAEEGAISSDDIDYDDGQGTVINKMTQIAANGRSTIAQQLESHHERRTELAQNIEGLSRQAFSKAVEVESQRALREFDEGFKRTQRMEERSFRALKAYRLRLNITRPARFPEWTVLHWGFVLLLFLVESVANSSIFSQASPFGLVGGLVQASVISGINVGMGLLGGMVVLPWRHLNMVTNRSVAWPTAVAVLIGFFVLIFNLATAHYRVLLEDDPTNAITGAINHLLESPLSINNFEAWTLLFIGLIFCIVAWLEGYKSDDPLRDYGHLTRVHEKAKQENAELKSAIRTAVVSKFGELKISTELSVRQATSMLGDFKALIERSKAMSSEFLAWRDQVEDHAAVLLSKYQFFYLQVHDLDPKPAYFSVKFKLPAVMPFSEESQRRTDAEARVPKLEKVVLALETVRDEGIDLEPAVMTKLEESVDDFFSQIEGVAARESDKETSGISTEAAPAS